MTSASIKPRSRRSVSPRWVLLCLALSFAGAFAIARELYQRYIAYAPIAARHLAPDAALAMRLDLEKVALYQPFREHWLPLIRQNQQNQRLKPRLERLRQHTRIEVGVDVREVVYSRGPTPATWVVALGGMFPKSGVVAGIQRVLEEEGRASQLVDGQTQTLRFQNGVWAGQAPSGVVLFASDAATLKGALAPGDPFKSVGLTLEEPLTLVAQAASSGAPSSRSSAQSGELFDGVSHIWAALTLANPQRVRLRLKLTGNASQQLEPVQRGLENLLEKVIGLPPPSLSLKVRGPDELATEMPITGAQLDRAAVLFAEELRAAAFSEH